MRQGAERQTAGEELVTELDVDTEVSTLEVTASPCLLHRPPLCLRRFLSESVSSASTYLSLNSVVSLHGNIYNNE